MANTRKQTQDIDTLRETWKTLYTTTLPHLARSRDSAQQKWPVTLDHCFARIILDNTIGRAEQQWDQVITKPAVKHMSVEQFRAAIELGEKIRDGSVDLVELDRRSLGVRGKNGGKYGAVEAEEGERGKEEAKDKAVKPGKWTMVPGEMYKVEKDGVYRLVNGGKMEKVELEELSETEIADAIADADAKAKAKEMRLADADAKKRKRKSGDETKDNSRKRKRGDGREQSTLAFGSGDRQEREQIPSTTISSSDVNAEAAEDARNDRSKLEKELDTTSSLTREQIVETLKNIQSHPTLTPFRKRLYVSLLSVPKGKYTSYAAMAEHLGSAARAVGNGMRNNPFAPDVPCHRVLASDGTLGGYGGDWSRDGKFTEKQNQKIKLLSEEGVKFDSSHKVKGPVWRGFWDLKEFESEYGKVC